MLPFLMQVRIRMSFDRKPEDNIIVKFVLIILESIFRIIDPILDWLLDFADKSNLSRRIALYTSVALTIYSTLKCWEIVEASPQLSNSLALAIGAIMAPVAGLTGALLKFYVETKPPVKPKAPTIGEPVSHDDIR